MDDDDAAMVDPAAPAPAMVLLEVFVPVVDELAELIRECGGPPRAPVWDLIGDGIPFPPWVSTEEREAAQRRAVREGILRYREEVEAPAEAILRERNAASAARKVVAFGGGEGARYRALLERIEPDLSHVARPPGVTSFALRVSSEGFDAVRGFHGGASIAGSDRNIVAIYAGGYRPGLSPRFYLVYDSWGNSLAAVPPLPPPSASSSTHRGLGCGVGVLRHAAPSDYVLAELLVRRLASSSQGSLFLWRSSGAAAGQWIYKEVVLPFPFPSDPAYNFCADTVFALGDTSMCWVDLLQGILVGDILAAEPEFRFIPLPEGYSRSWEPEDGRGRPRDFRSMCCVRADTIKFVSMDDGTLSTWTLRLPDPEWKRGAGGGSLFRVVDMWADPTYRELRLPQVAPKCPLLSLVDEEDDIVYLGIHDIKVIHEENRVEDRGHYVFSVDVRRGKVLTGCKLPPGRRVSHILASQFSKYLNKVHGI